MTEPFITTGYDGSESQKLRQAIRDDIRVLPDEVMK